MLKKILRGLKSRLLPSEFDLTIREWRGVNGDKLLKYEFNLDSESIVMDVGGFTGQWASDIFGKFCCKTLVFEPIKSFVEEIKNRFKRNNAITVYPFGLGGNTRKCDFSICGDASSVYGKSHQKVPAEIVDIFEFMISNKINHVDLIKINIEGGEYELLERIIARELASSFKNILVQFHNIDAKSEERMKSIQCGLEKTHRLKWQYKFVWELWERN